MTLAHSGTFMIFSSLHRLHIQSLTEKVDHLLVDLPEQAVCMHLSISPDDRYVAAIYRVSHRKKGLPRPPETYLHVIHIDEAKSCYFTKLLTPELGFRGLTFAKDGRSIVVYGTNHQTTYRFGDYLCQQPLEDQLLPRAVLLADSPPLEE